LNKYREIIPGVFENGEVLQLSEISNRIHKQVPGSEDLPASSLRSIVSRLEKEEKLVRIRKGLYKLNNEIGEGVGKTDYLATERP
jgi:predicted transcriptional regulator of viral defense system